MPFIPEGPWYCRRCMDTAQEDVSCALCPVPGGALKQVGAALCCLLPLFFSLPFPTLRLLRRQENLQRVFADWCFSMRRHIVLRVRMFPGGKRRPAVASWLSCERAALHSLFYRLALVVFRTRVSVYSPAAAT